MKGQKGFIAGFLITLVLMLPVYVSDVHAVSLLSVDKFRGADNLTGYVRGNYDTLNIEILASVSEQTRPITRDQLRISVEGVSNPYLFESCSSEPGAAGLYRCRYMQSGVFRGVKKYNISLLEEGSENILKSVAQALTADSYAPVVTSLNVTPTLTSTGQIAVAFSAEEYSVDRGNTAACSGFDRIEFYLGDASGTVIQRVLPTAGCAYSSSFSYTIPASVNGQTQVCAVAYDALGQRSDSVCRQLTIDRAPPQADSNSLRITVNGEVLRFVNPNAATPILADVEVRIIGEDLKEESVTADFSAITDASGFSNRPFSSHAIADYDEHIYTWNEVPIELVSSCLVTVKGKDNADNSMENRLFCSVSTDTTPPQVLDIFSLFSSDAGVPYISRTEGELAVEFREAGGGMDNTKVFIDMTNINGNARVRANSCNQTAPNAWVCYWKNIQPRAADGEYPAAVRGDSTDKLGNQMSKYDFTLGIDTTPPVLDAGNVEFASYHTGMDYGNVTVRGDVIEVIVPVSGFDAAFANFSSVGGPENVPPQQCWTDENGSFCLFSYNVGRSGPYSANIGFDFYDFSGNKVSTSYGFSVSGLKNDTNPNYWDIESIECSPNSIDRSITTLVGGGVKSFCRVKLRGHGSVATTAVELGDLSECTGDLGDYIYNIDIAMNSAGTREPYLAITLGSSKIDKDVLDFECPLYIMSKVTEPSGVYYTENPEIELVSKELLFYNMPLGEPGQRLVEKINAADDAAKIAGSWVDDFEKFFYWYEKICNAAQILSDVVAAIKSVSILIGGVSMVYKPAASLWVPICKGATELADIWKDFQTFLDDYACALATCSYSKKLFKEAGVEFGGSFDVKKSVIWSTLGLCIPGILAGLSKWRQIECQRAICYSQEVASGMRMYECDASYQFSTCKFILGEIFNAIPIVQVVSNYMGKVESYISNPGELVGWALTIVFELMGWCKEVAQCTDGQQAPRIGCDLVETINIVGKVIGDINGLVDQQDSWKKTPESICEQWEDVKRDMRSKGTGVV
jgi:hypothetical protein